MHRFYLPPAQWNPDALTLTGAEAHHAGTVLRLDSGARVVVFNGRGHEITAEIVSTARDEIRLRKLHEARTPPLRCQITLAQAIPKGKHMDLIVQKAVEIGASEIAPLISERTIVQIDEADAAQKQAKWQQIAIEAAKQCGQNWLPAVQRPRTPREFFAHLPPVTAGHDRRRDRGSGEATPETGAHRAPLPFDLQLIGSLQSDAVHLKTVLGEYAQEHGQRAESVLICIGPEGDFTPAELNLARSHGCRPITLGPIILRVETAAIYCLSVLSYELL